jgi:tryptophan synthase alpha subunit
LRFILPAEESKDYKKECIAADIDTIFLTSPSTHPDRLSRFWLRLWVTST